MIIFVTGTNGTGKTTLMRRVMELLPGDPEVVTIEINGKTKKVALRWPGFTVMGSYDSACGGCDKMSWKGASDDIERLIRAEADAGQHVLLEGIIITNWGLARYVGLNETYGAHQVLIDQPLEACVNSINERRRANAEEKGREFKPVPLKNVTDAWNGSYRAAERRESAGVPVYRLSREDAFKKVRELLCI